MSNTPMSKARPSASQPPSETSFKRKRGVFQKDLQHMMYGFGDDSNPLPETVALVEDIVVEYATDMVHKAQDIASNRGKLLTEDFLFLIRKDTPKLNRCTELLSMNEELKQARKAFDVDEEKLASRPVPIDPSHQDRKDELEAALLEFETPLNKFGLVRTRDGQVALVTSTWFTKLPPDAKLWSKDISLAYTGPDTISSSFIDHSEKLDLPQELIDGAKSFTLFLSPNDEASVTKSSIINRTAVPIRLILPKKTKQPTCKDALAALVKQPVNKKKRTKRVEFGAEDRIIQLMDGTVVAAQPRHRRRSKELKRNKNMMILPDRDRIELGHGALIYAIINLYYGRSQPTALLVIIQMVAEAVRIRSNGQCPDGEPTTNIVRRDGQCVNIKDSQYYNGNFIILGACENAQRNQLWTFKSDGTIRSNGKCLPSGYGGHVIAADSSTQGTVLMVAEDNNSSRQAWSAGNYTQPTINYISGFCEMCLQGNSANARVWLANCIFRTEPRQQWALYGDHTIRPYNDHTLCVTSDRWP
nr:transcription initiation factor TFIID subunit 13 [Tanacetum cinerariifolium]